MSHAPHSPSPPSNQTPSGICAASSALSAAHPALSPPSALRPHLLNPCPPTPRRPTKTLNSVCKHYAAKWAASPGGAPVKLRFHAAASLGQRFRGTCWGPQIGKAITVRGSEGGKGGGREERERGREREGSEERRVGACSVGCPAGRPFASRSRSILLPPFLPLCPRPV